MTVGTVPQADKYKITTLTALCRSEFPGSHLANTAEFIEGIGSGLVVPYVHNTQGGYVIMRTSGVVYNHFLDDFVDMYTGVDNGYGGYVAFYSWADNFEHFPTNPDFTFRAACAY